jgi:hypothetical protein
VRRADGATRLRSFIGLPDPGMYRSSVESGISARGSRIQREIALARSLDVSFARIS